MLKTSPLKREALQGGSFLSLSFASILIRMKLPQGGMRHYTHREGQSYPITLSQRLYTTFLAPFFIIALLIILSNSISLFPSSIAGVGDQGIFNYLGAAILATFMRMFVAYVLAVIVAFPLALLVVRVSWAERLLLPIFDIAQSIPVLAFFPMVIIAFTNRGLWDEAAIVVIFLAMIWNIVFNLVSGFKSVPRDIEWAAIVFKLSSWRFFTEVLLPASVPSFVIGSLLAWAQGWNIIIVAEALHLYLPKSNPHDLFGIGSILVSASATGNGALFISAIITMILTIAIIDFLVWQKLLHYAERFKFD